MHPMFSGLYVAFLNIHITPSVLPVPLHAGQATVGTTSPLGPE